ncbi:hypothetical protein TIFTF001_013415 [Ficus carica]|uniref:Uncharacterized protein n=1 Tax=Ficus carica TaxID=3494 RepID=A0AA87ZUX0_FICCA|nr:hypothetical protein TIFTF001_013415 [Ficus carica]
MAGKGDWQFGDFSEDESAEPLSLPAELSARPLPSVAPVVTPEEPKVENLHFRRAQLLSELVVVSLSNHQTNVVTEECRYC